MRIFVADIGGTAIKMAIANEQEDLTNQEEIPTNSHLGGVHLMNTLIEHIQAAGPIDAVGISTAGQVDSEKGTIIYANENIPHYTGTAIRQLIQAKIPVPVAVENDVNCAAIGEWQYGAAKGAKDFLCLTYGTGIGGAIVADGKLIKGSKGIAGEFGHIMTHGDGLPCNCGRKGCYEQYASTTVLIKEAQTVDTNLKNGRAFMKQIMTGDKKLQTIMKEWVKEVSYGLATLTHIFNPSLIIIGGGIMENDDIVKQVREQTQSIIMDSFQTVEIRRAQLGNQAGLYGALYIAAQLHQQKEKRTK